VAGLITPGPDVVQVPPAGVPLRVVVLPTQTW